MKKPPVDQGQNRKTMLSEASKSKKADNFVILEEYPDYSSEEEEWNKIKIRASNEQIGPSINVNLHMSVSSLIVKDEKKKRDVENIPVTM